MSWQDQGRQQHQWFGHGTAPGKGAGGDSQTLEQRIEGAVYCSVAALPAQPSILRQRASSLIHGGGLSRLGGAMAVWCQGLGLGKAEWAARMLGRDAEDPVAGMLHEATLAVASGERDGVRQAAESLAAGMQVVGMDRWPGFVADAQARAAVQAKAEDDFASKPGGLAPVPLVEDTGRVVLNNRGLPMMRPAGMDAHFFVEQGLADKEAEAAMLASGSEAGAPMAFV